MEILYIVIISLLLVSITTDIIYAVTKNKLIKVIEQQNVLLWGLQKESNEILKELIKENLKQDGGEVNE